MREESAELGLKTTAAADSRPTKQFGILGYPKKVGHESIQNSQFLFSEILSLFIKIVKTFGWVHQGSLTQTRQVAAAAAFISLSRDYYYEAY